MRQPERQLTTADRHWGRRSRWITLRWCG